MNEQLKEALTQFLQQLLTVVEAGKEQLPEVLTQVVQAQLLSANIWWWFSLAVIVFGLVLLAGGIALSSDSSGDDGVGVAIFGGLVMIGGGIALVCNWYDLIYTERFPKLVILDYLRHLL